MSRSKKLLLLTLGISSAIHLALAAGFLWLDNTASTPSAQAMVEISLQQTAAPELVTSRRQKTANEPVLSTQDAPHQQKTAEDSSNLPITPQPVEAKEPEAHAEAETAAETPHTKDVAIESVSTETEEQLALNETQAALAGQQNTEHSLALEAEKQNYLGRVAEHINSYKYYPRSAIRRATEGQVEVSFDLQPDGSIENLRTRGEHSVLLSASQRSIEQALPMPQRSDELLALGAIHIEFSMKYFLHEQ